MNFKKDVQLAVNGNSEAFARLYSIVYENMYHVALYSLHNSHDACDAVSETVLDAFTSIKKLRNENAFKCWIFKILAVKIKKKQAEYSCISSDAEDISQCEDILKSNFDFESLELAEALYKIDDTERLILSLSVMEGYSSKEISVICGLKPATVRSKLSRTKEKLKKYLDNQGDDFYE